MEHIPSQTVSFRTLSSLFQSGTQKDTPSSETRPAVLIVSNTSHTSRPLFISPGGGFRLFDDGVSFTDPVSVLVPWMRCRPPCCLGRARPHVDVWTAPWESPPGWAASHCKYSDPRRGAVPWSGSTRCPVGTHRARAPRPTCGSLGLMFHGKRRFSGSLFL